MNFFLVVFSAFLSPCICIYAPHTHLLESSKEKLGEKQLGKETNWLLASYEAPQLFLFFDHSGSPERKAV